MKSLVIMCLISLSCHAQEIEAIKTADTVYIFFRKNDTTNYKKVKFRHGGNKYTDEYFLTDSNQKIIFIKTTNDKNTESKKNQICAKRKEFLARNKDVIIDMEFINKHGMAEIFIGLLEVQWNKKTIFVVTDEALTKRKLILLKAGFGYSDFIKI